MLVLSVICVRTMVYAVYQKNQGNTFGAVGLIVLGLLALILPMVAIWLRS